MNKTEQERVPTGSPDIDLLLHGGFEPGTITQIYGEPASGKSTLSIIFAVTCLRSSKSVLFFDTEGFSVERFSQVAGDDAASLAENLYIYEPNDFDQQGIMIAGTDTVLKTKNVGLIIVDSATALYRTDLSRGKDAMQKLTRQIVHLLGLGKRYGIPVVVTNQVYVDTTTNVYMALGGTALEHISKAIIRLTRAENGLRRATLTKHRSIPPGGSFNFVITGDGIKKVD
ncbi:MAG TPA: DNA repair and recombination protein RadB [Methanoregulaceae archaeon]|nr:DNA repair and recombination protein RadB [Methanoregulaceae archaeon]